MGKNKRNRLARLKALQERRELAIMARDHDVWAVRAVRVCT